MRVFRTIAPTTIPTESMVLGVSKLGGCKLSEAEVYRAIKNAMSSHQPKKDHSKDALIAETAMLNEHTLLTSDKTLAAVVANFGGKVIRIPNRA